jgi:alpha-beta hydrolase superfamily lysophospholipase
LRKVILFLLLALLVVGCRDIVRGPGAARPYENIRLNTTDGVIIGASYYPSESNDGLILLHMTGKTRRSYDNVAKELMERYKIISIDFRGYGDSDGESVDMTEKEFKNLVLDVEAAEKVLREQGVKTINIAGASLGANVALLYAVDHPVDKLALLAPGSVLRGLDITRTSYKGNMLVLVGRSDAYASISVDELQGNWQNAHIMMYETGAHGTDLLTYDLSAHEDFLFYFS